MWLVLSLSLVSLILAFTPPLKSWPLTTRQVIDAGDSSSKVKPLEDVHILEIKNSDIKLDPTWTSKIEKAIEITPGSMKIEEASTIKDINKGKPTTTNELNVVLKSRNENTDLNTQMTSQNPLKHNELEHENVNVDEMAIPNKPSSSNIIPDSSVENKIIFTPPSLTETPIHVIKKRQLNVTGLDYESLKPVLDNKPVSSEANTDSVSENENHTYVDYADNKNKAIPSHEQLIPLAAEIAKLYPLIQPKAVTTKSAILPIANVMKDASGVIWSEKVVNGIGQIFNKFAPTDATAEYENHTADEDYSKVGDRKVRRQDTSHKSRELTLDDKTVATINSSPYLSNFTEDASDKKTGDNHTQEIPPEKIIGDIINKSHGLILNHTLAIINVTEDTSDKTMVYRHHDEAVKNDQTTNANMYSNITEATKSIASSELSPGISSEL